MSAAPAGAQRGALAVVVAAGVRSCGRRSIRVGLAARSSGVKPLEIALPQLILPCTEIVKIIPGVNARVVPVGKLRPDRVVAHRLDLGDGHFALARLQSLLAGAVAAHLGRR